jgi:uncharacterized protein (DUF2147 family)
MKNQIICSLIFVVIGIFSMQAQSVLGQWKTVDDQNGKAKSIVEIYQENGKLFGKIIEIVDQTKQEKVCQDCEGSNKGKKIKGLVILENLIKKGFNWEDGTILDPNSGKVYKCTLSLVNENKLKVRGYVGISLFGRTQYWQRVR